MTKIGMALGGAAVLGAMLLAGVGTASAAQGPHHHPTHNGAGGLVNVDGEVTVYRENVNNQNRWCIYNAHHTGGVQKPYSVYYGVFEVNRAWLVARPPGRLRSVTVGVG